MRIDFFLPRTPDSNQLRNWALDTLAKQFGGVTWLTANGRWQSDNCSLHEQVDWLTCYTDGLVDVARLWVERSFMPKLAEQYALESSPQDVFLFVINNTPWFWEAQHGHEED